MLKKFLLCLALVIAFASSAFGDMTIHYSYASLSDGHTDYSDARFGYLGFALESDDMIITDENNNLSGDFTLSGGNYSFWNGSEMQKVSGTSQTFKVAVPSWVGSGDTATFQVFLSNDKEVRFALSADNGLNGVKANWIFPKYPSLNEEYTVPHYRSTKEQLESCVLYFEFIRSGENVTGINWRVVNPSDVTKPVSQDFDMNFLRMEIRNFDNSRVLNTIVDAYIPAGETPEGVFMFDNTVKESEIWRIRTKLYTYDEEVEKCYVWWFYTSTQSNFYLWNRHTSNASLINGKSDYRNAKFSEVYFSVENEHTLVEAKNLTGAGRITVPGGGYTLLDVDTNETLETIKGDKTFSLKISRRTNIGDADIAFLPVNDEGKYVSLIGEDETSLNGKMITWTFPSDPSINGSVVFPSYKTTQEQLASGVPYIEIVSEDGYITAVNYKIVTSSDTSTAITPSYRTDFVFRFDRSVDFWTEYYEPSIQRNSASGTCTLDTPQPLNKIKRIRARLYSYEEDASNPAVYQWNFYPANPNVEEGLAGINFNGHVYRAFTLNNTWQEARDYCENLGGHLAILTEDGELEAVESMLAPAGNRTYWVGARQISSNSWQWINGETSEAPEYNHGDTLAVNSMGEYISYSNNTSLPFICEWEPVSADFAPEAPEYTRYVENPEAYFEGLEFYGELPDPLDLSHLANNPVNNASFYAADVLPSLYDPRSSGLLPSVKDQGLGSKNYNTCWSFASLGALETSYNMIKQAKAAPDLSELYQAWFAYMDPRDGYSFEMGESKSNEHPVLDQGGHITKAIDFMSRSGTAYEDDLPYERLNEVSSLTANKTPENFTHPIILKEAYRLGPITETNRDKVKRLIMSHGALHASMLYSSSELSQFTYYSPTNEGFGHAVNLVGWDDNYVTSGGKGAWLAKNSMTESFADGGYFWISYAQVIGDCGVFIAGENLQGMKCKGYDVLTSSGRINYHWSANIFRADEDENIMYVAFHTADDNVPYEIYINKLGKIHTQNPGIPETPAASGIMEYTGYHTIALNNPVDVSAGEYYSVIVKLGQPSAYSYPTAVEDTGAVSAVSVRTGESYFALAEAKPELADWKDGKIITDDGESRACNACIKVFTLKNDLPVKSEDIIPAQDTNGNGQGSSGGGCNVGLTLAGLALVILLRKH